MFTQQIVRKLILGCCSLLMVVGAPHLSAALAPLQRDGYTSTAQPTTAFGSATTCRVSGTERCWLRFQVLSSILPPGTTGSQVERATLTLYASSGCSAATPCTVAARRVLGTWSEGTLTNQNAPVTGTTDEGTATASGPGFVAIDITGLVQEWVDGTLSNDGVVLTRTAGSSAVVFNTKEHTGTSHEPLLDISVAGPQGPAGPAGANGPAGPQGPVGPAGPGIPTGAVMHFNLATCPTGWTELTVARGRYLVALPSGGTLGLTAGSALSNGEDRPTGQHRHFGTVNLFRSDTQGGGRIVYGSGADGPSVNSGNISGGLRSEGASPSDTLPGTNAPYLQLLLCEKT